MVNRQPSSSDKMDVSVEPSESGDKDGGRHEEADEEVDGLEGETELEQKFRKDPNIFMRKARYVPLRLTYDERSLLRLLESALEVSEYTDKVDVFTGGNKARLMAVQIRQICSILCGLVVAHNYEIGQALIKDREFADNADFFKIVFEIGRRYKILNPERMRGSYGKLLFLLQDSVKPDVRELLGFSPVADEVVTVYKVLEHKKNGLALLKDPLLCKATMEILPEGKSRAQIQREIRTKEDAQKALIRKYASRNVTRQAQRGGRFFTLSLGLFEVTKGTHPGGSDTDSDDEDKDRNAPLLPDDIEQCIYSLGDHNSHLRFNRYPCDKMIKYLKDHFSPDEYEDHYSLAISAGRGGARLSHSHKRQYTYVLQSLELWRDVLHFLFELWHRTEKDLLNPNNPYRLRDTGQGLNRVQSAPNVSDAVHRIINRVQNRVGGWVGSSVVHLGDHNVPNALVFIDKYIQVPRILSPVVLCLDKIDEVYTQQDGLKSYIDSTFGGPTKLKKLILCDFFRHAFDGSGADNFFDAGSCIDGRLTSAWNWCSKVEKKSYFPVFLLTGFTGFDGRF